MDELHLLQCLVGERKWIDVLVPQAAAETVRKQGERDPLVNHSGELFGQVGLRRNLVGHLLVDALLCRAEQGVSLVEFPRAAVKLLPPFGQALEHLRLDIA